MKNDQKKSAFAERLEKACSGLIYISETDAPIEPFVGGKVRSATSAMILEAIEKDDSEKIDEVSFEVFFARLTKPRDWHGSEENKRTKQFAKLKDLLKDNLADLKVFRFGKVRIDIYAVGIDEEGRVAGIKTRAVET
jgi:hypothetical protein